MSPHLILQVPHTIFVSELFIGSSGFGEDTTFKATHVEQEVGVVLGVDRDKGILPLYSRYGARESVFNVPEHSSVREEAQ